jgi:2-iminobutanoate/2-iminopropanoate deaminase
MCYPRRMTVRKIVVDGLIRLPAFSHATIAGDQVFVAGMLGTDPDTDELVPGGTAAETLQSLRNMEKVLTTCGATFADVAKVNVYLTDMTDFAVMNEAYIAVLGADPPARITIGCTALALGAKVELDCIAFVPSP